MFVVWPKVQGLGLAFLCRNKGAKMMEFMHRAYEVRGCRARMRGWDFIWFFCGCISSKDKLSINLITITTSSFITK